MTPLLANKTILIVGAAGGLGAAHAWACANAGAKLVLCDAGRDVEGRGAEPERLHELGQALATAQIPCLLDTQPIEQPGAAQALIERTLTEYGRIDGLIYCAGLHRPTPLLSLTDEDLMSALEVQALAAIRTSREVAKAMRRSGSGSIVLTIGAGALQGAHRQSHHAAADGALTAFVRSAALDLRRHQVRINALASLALTRTTAALPMFRNHHGSMTADHVAKVALFLLSDAATHVTGETVGSAGTRLYGLRLRETAGQMLDQTSDQTLDVATIAAAFKDATRP